MSRARQGEEHSASPSMIRTRGLSVRMSRANAIIVDAQGLASNSTRCVISMWSNIAETKRDVRSYRSLCMNGQDLADVEKALSTCVPPEPPRAPSTNATNDTTRPESSEDGPKKGLDDDRGVSATVLAEEALSSRQGQGQDGTPSSELSGGGNGSSDIDNDDDRLRNRDSSNPYTATEAQGGSADYMDFVRVRGMVSKKAAAFFTPGTFLRYGGFNFRSALPCNQFDYPPNLQAKLLYTPMSCSRSRAL